VPVADDFLGPISAGFDLPVMGCFPRHDISVVLDDLSAAPEQPEVTGNLSLDPKAIP
jgi:hypothetical protein